MNGLLLISLLASISAVSLVKIVNHVPANPHCEYEIASMSLVVGNVQVNLQPGDSTPVLPFTDTRFVVQDMGNYWRQLSSPNPLTGQIVDHAGLQIDYDGTKAGCTGFHMSSPSYDPGLPDARQLLKITAEYETERNKGACVFTVSLLEDPELCVTEHCCTNNDYMSGRCEYGEVSC